MMCDFAHIKVLMGNTYCLLSYADAHCTSANYHLVHRYNFTVAWPIRSNKTSQGNTIMTLLKQYICTSKNSLNPKKLVCTMCYPLKNN